MAENHNSPVIDAFVTRRGSRAGCYFSVQAREPLVVGARVQVVEEIGAEIALARVGQHHEQHRARLRRLGRLERRGERCAGRDADEDAFLACEAARHVLAFLVRDRHELIEHLRVQHVGQEVGRPALDLVRRPRFAAEQRRAGRLRRDDLHLGPRELDHLAGARQRAARAPARDPEVEPAAGEVLQDLGTRRLPVIGRVRGILELPREEPAVLLGERRREPHHARAALGGRREDHLGAERAHDLAAFDGERLDHRRDERIALGRAHHRERDAGVARRRFDDGLARLQGSAALGVVDDGEREAVLDRMAAG